MRIRTILAAVLAGLMGSAWATAAVVIAPRPEKVFGEVTNLGDKTITITARDRDATMTTVTCTEATKITREGAKSGAGVKFEDLRCGESVRVSYDPAKKTALSILIEKAAPSNTATHSSSASGALQGMGIHMGNRPGGGRGGGGGGGGGRRH